MKRLFYFLVIVTACAPNTAVDELYEPFSPSIIEIVLGYNPSDTVTMSAFAVTNIPTEVSQSQKLTAFARGSYFLDLEIDRPTKSIVYIGTAEYNVFVLPHDTSTIVANSTADNDLSFEGNAATINKFYLEKKKRLGYTNKNMPMLRELTSKATYRRLNEKMDSITDRESLFLNEYTSSKELPDWFLNYEKAEITYSCAGYKTQLPHANEVLHMFEDSLPSDYFDYLETIKIDNEQALLSKYYFMFLNDYFLRDLPVKEWKDLENPERTIKLVDHQLLLSSSELTGRTKELFQLSEFGSLMRFLDDSVQVDSAARKYGIDPISLMRIMGTRSALAARMAGPAKGDTIPNFSAVNRLDSLISIREFQDKVVFINFWASWCAPCLRDIPDLNNLIATYKDNPEVVFINVCIDDEKSKWLRALDNNGLIGLHLKAEGNWNKLIRSYFAIQGIPHHAILAKGNIVHENFSSISKETIDALVNKK